MQNEGQKGQLCNAAVLAGFLIIFRDLDPIYSSKLLQATIKVIKMPIHSDFRFLFSFPKQNMLILIA